MIERLVKKKNINLNVIRILLDIVIEVTKSFFPFFYITLYNVSIDQSRNC